MCSDCNTLRAAIGVDGRRSETETLQCWRSYILCRGNGQRGRKAESVEIGCLILLKVADGILYINEIHIPGARFPILRKRYRDLVHAVVGIARNRTIEEVAGAALLVLRRTDKTDLST